MGNHPREVGPGAALWHLARGPPDEPGETSSPSSSSSPDPGEDDEDGEDVLPGARADNRPTALPEERCRPPSGCRKPEPP
jgi:hypothetical protein